MAIKPPRAKRQSVSHDAMIYETAGAQIAPCVLRNISVTGAQIELQRETDLPKTFMLSFSANGGVRRRCTIVWQFSTVVGVKFALSRGPK
jgi:hypothetical protein